MSSVTSLASAADLAAAERSRIFTVLEHPEAKGRETAALQLAKVPGMSAAQAGPILAGLPKAVQPSAEGGQFVELLAKLGITERDLLAAADIISTG